MRAARYFLICHGWSWACWSLAWVIAGERPIFESPGAWLVYLGGLGPPLAGIWMTAMERGREGLKDLGRRLVDVTRVGGRWWAAIFLLPPLFMATAAAMHLAVGLPGTGITLAGPLAAASGPLAGAANAGSGAEGAGRLLISLFLFALFVLVFGPLPEEIGWRGYLLDTLQERHDALGGSLILAAAWGLWHLPLFLLPGYFGEGGPPALVPYMAGLLGTTLILTWIYNGTGRSVLAAVLYHFANNFTGMLFEGDATVEWFRAAVGLALALVVVIRWGPRHMAPPQGTRRETAAQ